MASVGKETSSLSSSTDVEKCITKEAESIQPLSTGEISEMTVIAEGEDRTTLFVWLLVLCCGISGLLFGIYNWIKIHGYTTLMSL